MAECAAREGEGDWSGIADGSRIKRDRLSNPPEGCHRAWRRCRRPRWSCADTALPVAELYGGSPADLIRRPSWTANPAGWRKAIGAEYVEYVGRTARRPLPDRPLRDGAWRFRLRGRRMPRRAPPAL